VVATAQFQLKHEDLPEELVAAIGPHLARQRWYAGAGAPGSVKIEEAGCLAELASGARLLWAVAAVAEPYQGVAPNAGAGMQLRGSPRDSYQLVLAERPDGEAAELAAARAGSLMASALVASAGGKTYYDATVDPEMSVALLEVASGGAQHAQRARPLGAEQSNSSVVYDERVILKLFRRLSPGPNPDAEVTSALAQAGFSHVAVPVLRWRKGQTDLAFAQQYLAGGTDGWALALTSLRDLYSPATASLAAGEPEDEDATLPGLQGGDFAAEARRLGRVTAQMHISMAAAFGTSANWSSRWQQLRASLHAQIGELVPELLADAQPLLERLEEVPDVGPALRGHGDYHLGQVMRTDAGWYVLDFEGEPNRPLEERLSPTSAMKDVAGMLRSFHYAAYFAIAERGTEVAVSPELGGLAQAWEERNREAFMRGYMGHEGIADLLPASLDDRDALRSAFEVEKALYELSYERAFRPSWAGIPMDALHKLLAGPLAGSTSSVSRPGDLTIDLEARQASSGRLN
jgi:maltokinase